MLPCWVRVDLGAMAMKRCSIFPKAPALLEPHHQIVSCHIQDTNWVGVLLFCRDAVGVFYSPSRLGKSVFGSQRTKKSIAANVTYELSAHPNIHNFLAQMYRVPQISLVTFHLEELLLREFIIFKIDFFFFCQFIRKSCLLHKSNTKMVSWLSIW